MISGFSSAELNSPNSNYCCSIQGPFRIPVLVIMVLLTISCENDIEVIKSFSRETVMPSQSMIEAEIRYTDSARLQLLIIAPEIHNYTGSSEDYTEFPGGVEAEFFNRDGNSESQLSSKYAIYYAGRDLWEVKDSVVVINQAGEILNTDQLFWDEKNRLIYSDSFVKITRPDEVITGEGFEADETFTRWKIKKIRGTLYLDDDAI